MTGQSRTGAGLVLVVALACLAPAGPVLAEDTAGRGLDAAVDDAPDTVRQDGLRPGQAERMEEDLRRERQYWWKENRQQPWKEQRQHWWQHPRETGP